MDDRLRSAGHDARTEIESALDTETELATLHAAAANGVTPNAAVVIPPVSRRRTPALLGAALIAVVFILPDGIVGLYRRLAAKYLGPKASSADPVDPPPNAVVDVSPST